VAAWITAGATVGGTLILLATAILALRSLADAKRTRHGQLVVELSRRWEAPELRATLQEYGRIQNAGITQLIDKLFGGQQTASKQDLDDFNTLAAYPNLIDTIGVLESEGVIDSRLIRKLWGPLIVSQWRGWEQAVDHVRKYDNQDAEATYRYFESLAKEMMRLDQLDDEDAD